MKKPFFDVVVLTDRRYVNPEITSTYVQNVITEDSLVVNALKKEGLQVTRIAWDDSDFDWSNTRFALFRTTWDYFDRFTEFSIWLENVSKQTKLINSERLIKWNLDKHYLQHLHNKGVPIPPTLFIEKGAATTLQALCNKKGWQEVILKPCVSGAARHTYKINQENISEHEHIFKTLVANEAMMLQPYLKNVTNKGEISLMVFNQTVTHAILKKAKPGDFRVQDDFGGTVHPYTPTKNEIDLALQAVNACIEMPVYARVDIMLDNNNNLVVSELELIEPELWFRENPEAATILAKQIRKLVYEN